MTRQPRRQYLIKPRLQFKLVGIMLALVLVGFLLQSFLFHAEIQRLVGPQFAGSEEARDFLPLLEMRVLLLSVVVLLPTTLAVAMLYSHRIAGPVHRLESYLREIEQGEANAICRLRRGDELKELCTQLNRTLTTIEARGGRVWPPEEFSGCPMGTKEAAREEFSRAA